MRERFVVPMARFVHEGGCCECRSFVHPGGDVHAVTAPVIAFLGPDGLLKQQRNNEGGAWNLRFKVSPAVLHALQENADTPHIEYLL